MYIYRRFVLICAIFALSYGYPTVILRLSYGYPTVKPRQYHDNTTTWVGKCRCKGTKKK